MAILPTVRVMHPKDYTVINRQDYDPGRHTLYGESEPEPESSPEPTPEPEPEPVPEALTLINEAESASDITPLPGIGTVSGTTILAERPVGGYISLSAVAAVPGLSTQIDWDLVAQWAS